MGMFSFMRADNETKQKNFVCGDSIKMLIPKEFGGGNISGKYDGYGRIQTSDYDYDIYQIVAVMNKNFIKDDMEFSFDYTAQKIREGIVSDDIYEKIDKDRIYGIAIGCYDEQQEKLKYPIKLVSARFKGTYEDIDGFSKSDSNQGFRRVY